MNRLLDLVLGNNLIFDIAGLAGLALIAAAAIKLSIRNRSWGGNTMAIGALALFLARLFLVVWPYIVTNEMLYAIGPVGISLTIGVPPILLTLGFAAVVWGLWSHERWLGEEAS